MTVQEINDIIHELNYVNEYTPQSFYNKCAGWIHLDDENDFIFDALRNAKAMIKYGSITKGVEILKMVSELKSIS